MYGFSGVGRAGLFELGLTAKRTGPRYVYDTNLPVFKGPIAGPTQVFSATAPAYWLVNVDARMKLSMIKGLEKSYLQLNVYNLFDTLYVGGFGGGLNQSLSGSNYGSAPFVQIGAPRTVVGTLHINF
jgi:iron complex outermembrane receptor protein